MIDSDYCVAISGVNDGQGKPEYSENTSRCRTVQNRPHIILPKLESAPPQWGGGGATDCLSYDTVTSDMHF
jgi:hypothetical protein